MKKIGFLIITYFVWFVTYSQNFYFGHDLSYVNMMEDCGAVFKENGVAKDVYKIFADHGTNLVRARLWVDPTWQNSLQQPAGVKLQYSDLDDVVETFTRSKAYGMKVMLDLHFSDFWADPGRQVIPKRWQQVAYNTTALRDSIKNYVKRVLLYLDSKGIMPEFVKIGNETNIGICVHYTMDQNYNGQQVISNDWNRHAQLFNAAIAGVREISANTIIKPKIVLHFAGLDKLEWLYSNIISKGVTDFDIMGFSYYYAWHGGSIKDLGNVIRNLKTKFPKYDVMVVETGYLWSTQNFDAMPNIISTPDPSYLPVIPEKQLEYMVDYTREVMKAGGIGVIFWEPAWVSTPCRTPWGQGSSHDHVAFFSPYDYNFMENGGGKWTHSEFYSNLNARKVVFKLDMTGQNHQYLAYISGTFSEPKYKIIRMAYEGNNIFSYFTFINPNDSGGYYYLRSEDFSSKENIPNDCKLWEGRDRLFKIYQNDTIINDKWENCSLTNVKLQENNKQIIIYSDSINKMLTIQFSENLFIKEKKLILIIYDINGKVINKKIINAFNNIYSLNLSKYSSGIYFIKISGSDYNYSEKIILY